ncbi:hypothetical protein [Microbacterium sp. YY-01]|uniref:hypothetical protein n=1 Tax=Microbacterium sp. YY-01 TaxID=3421634 RepID=UPI003D1813CA
MTLADILGMEAQEAAVAREVTKKARKAVTTRRRYSSATGDSRTVEFQDQIRELHRQGLTDKEIAARLNTSFTRVSQSRRRMEIPPNVAETKADRIIELVKNGHTDADAAAATGASIVYVKSVRLKAGIHVTRKPTLDDMLPELIAAGMDAQQIADKVGRHRHYVAARMRALKNTNHTLASAGVISLEKEASHERYFVA